MRNLLLSILLGIAGIQPVLAVPLFEDSTAVKQKLYFPVRSFADSTALSQAIPSLAEKLLPLYKEENKKTYFGNKSNYYLLTGNYSKAIEMIDSAQKIADDQSYGIELKSYALASIKEKSMTGSFRNSFTTDFESAFNKLSFRKKVIMNFVELDDTAYYRKDFLAFTETLKKNNADSINLDDAQALCDKFSSWSVYSSILPLMKAVTNKPQYSATFPAIKGFKWAGVVPVQDIDETIDPSMQYKLLMELTSFAPKGQDSAAKKEINGGLGEVARLINLHSASGVPKKNIHVAIVVHAPALYVFATNEKYKKKYKTDNPNIALIKELQDFGVKIIVCGQAMTFFQLEKEELLPGIKQALTAQTILSSYQLKGYVYYDLGFRE